MLDFIAAPVEMDLGVGLKVVVKKVPDTVDVLGLHGSNASNLGVLWELVHSDVTGQRHASLKRGELYVNQLFAVDVAVPVSRMTEGRGDGWASSINSLPNLLTVNSAGDLFDQHRCQFLRSQLCVYTEIVNLTHLNFFAIRDNVNWDASNKRKERVFLSSTDTQEPVFVITRRREGPA